jgi:hypothetical protein
MVSCECYALIIFVQKYIMMFKNYFKIAWRNLAAPKDTPSLISEVLPLAWP